jgi:hypothetical protein
MNFQCQDSRVVCARVASSGRERAATLQRTRCPQPRASAPESGGLIGYLLGWTVPLAFCSGLIGLGVSSPFEVAVPRWLILAHGAGCVLVALLALLLTRPWQQVRPSARQHPCWWKDVDADCGWAATWNETLSRGRSRAISK